MLILQFTFSKLVYARFMKASRHLPPFVDKNNTNTA